MIDKAGRQTFDQLQGIVDLAQKQGPGVGGQRPAVETSLDPAPFRLSKIKSRRGPVRMHRGHRESRNRGKSPGEGSMGVWLVGAAN